MSSNYWTAFTLIEMLIVIAIVTLLAAVLFPVFGRAREQARASQCLSNTKQIGTAIKLYVDDNDETYPMSRFPDAKHPLSGCTNGNGDALAGSQTNWKRVIQPFLKDRGVWTCPSNDYQWNPGGYNGLVNVGDETNIFYSKSERLPISYAYNGSYFHESIPPCWLGEQWVRGRYVSEIETPSSLLMLLETRFSFPDLGDWWLKGRVPNSPSLGPFQSHNGMCNWLFADLHAKALKPQATCIGKAGGMWTAGAIDPWRGCDNLQLIAPEYK